MQNSEKEWYRSSDNDHYALYSKSLSSLQDLESVPCIYGRKNQRYVSPTFRSNTILYGEQKYRERPDEIFSTMKDTQMGSPQLNQYKEKTDVLKIQSTNKHAPYQNTFHKSSGNLNYKNYSEVQLGFNQNIKDTYQKQFYERGKACEVKFGSTTDDYGAYENVRNSPQNIYTTLDGNKSKTMKQQQSHEKFSPQVEKYQNEISPKRVQFDFNPKIHSKSTFETEVPTVITYPLSQRDDFTKAIPTRHRSKLGYHIDEMSFKYRPLSPQVNRQNKTLAKDDSYQAPDWNFFSPQSDPIQKAYQLKSMERVKSVDRVYQDKQAYFSDQKLKYQKQILQETCESPCGDQFMQTFKGDTLKLSHKALQSKLERRRKAIIQEQASQQYKDMSRYNKSVLQISHQNQENTNIFQTLGQRDEIQYMNTLRDNRDYIANQIDSKTHKQRSERLQKMFQERQIVEEALQTQAMINSHRNQYQSHVRDELNRFYNQAKEQKQRDQIYRSIERQQDKEFLDQGIYRARSREYENQNQRMQIQLQLSQNYKENVELKQEQRHQARNYQPLSQRMTQVIPHSRQQKVNQSQVTIQSLRTLENINSAHNQSNHNHQISMHQINAPATHYDRSFVSSQAAPEKCLSNASTVSSCSMQQVTKAEISKQEFELRKKMLQNRKSGRGPLESNNNHLNSFNQQQKQKERNQSPNKKAPSGGRGVKFNIKSNQVENYRLQQ
ncbi:UNKNOWN [Stylonychia lemnae]|uniref:Uncharacterized protein n=1 Tax=Stylonychia lemnae TaxID=5949 RepID=A0A078AM97_STYLE|nr:UNKNOWN [Stylonychia lemnae]|eukprot:CDW83021.1 UNKNOWN [Stylonychia lemnae]